MQEEKKQNNTEQRFNVEQLLSDLFLPNESLKELFERRLSELGISQNNALDILDMSYRSLNGILEGELQIVDITNFSKLASFFQSKPEDIFKLYLKSFEKNNPKEGIISPDKIKFIKEKFDLAALKKVGFIDSIVDFSAIEKKIVEFLGLKSIFEYQNPKLTVAFSASKIKPKNELTRENWIYFARKSFELIDNPNEYDKEGLVKFFPEIRWHSMNVELGLTNIIQQLYNYGVTVIYQAPLPSLHLRGATFCENGKPCIVLTDLKGFYPTLWFSLIHELFHVLFDWEEIKSNRYHISLENETILSVKEKEDEANDFAREYLFSKEKTIQAHPYRNDILYIKKYTENNHVHPSFFYVFNAYDASKNNGRAWALARKFSPNIKDTIKYLENPWNNTKEMPQFIKTIKHKIYI